MTGAETLPALEHDPNRPEDVLKVDADWRLSRLCAEAPARHGVESPESSVTCLWGLTPSHFEA